MDSHQHHVLVETLAWTLLHFLWQGTVIAILLALALAAIGESTARTRYILRCAALALMGLVPIVSFIWLWGEAPPLPELSLESLAALGGLTGIPRGMDSLDWVVGLWSIGALLCVTRLCGGLLQVKRLRRRNEGEALSRQWQARFEELARGFGVKAYARIVDSAALCVPVVIGFAKPIVLLPARLFTGLSDEQIEALLAHELAHIARHDYIVNIVQSIVESLLFYHPAVWWVSRGIRVEREYCCDDLAVAATHNGLVYAHALTALESWRGAHPQLGVSTLGGSLMLRIQRLVGIQPAKNRKTLRPAHAIAGLIVASTLSASALAVATLPDPAKHDCECSCHAKAQVPVVGWKRVRAPHWRESSGAAPTVVEEKQGVGGYKLYYSPAEPDAGGDVWYTYAPDTDAGEDLWYEVTTDSEASGDRWLSTTTDPEVEVDDWLLTTDEPAEQPELRFGTSVRRAPVRVDTWRVLEGRTERRRSEASEDKLPADVSVRSGNLRAPIVTKTTTQNILRSRRTEGRRVPVGGYTRLRQYPSGWSTEPRSGSVEVRSERRQAPQVQRSYRVLGEKTDVYVKDESSPQGYRLLPRGNDDTWVYVQNVKAVKRGRTYRTLSKRGVDAPQVQAVDTWNVFRVERDGSQ